MRTENIYSVYVHKNLKNDKYYVGMTSKEPKERFNYGFGYKNNSKMWNDIKESDWNKDWVHGILGKFTDKNEALKYEAFLIAMLDSVRNGYNTSSFDSNHYKRSEEHKRKISESHIGKHHSEETKKKLSESHTGKPLSEEHRKKLSESLTGRVFSEEHRKRMSDSQPKKPVLQFSKGGDLIAEYPSTMEAERQTGCANGSICKCCKGKLKSCGGYIWQYA